MGDWLIDSMLDTIEDMASDLVPADAYSLAIQCGVKAVEKYESVPYSNQINGVAEELRTSYDKLFELFDVFAETFIEDAKDIKIMAEAIAEFDAEQG